MNLPEPRCISKDTWIWNLEKGINLIKEGDEVSYCFNYKIRKPKSINDDIEKLEPLVEKILQEYSEDAWPKKFYVVAGSTPYKGKKAWKFYSPRFQTLEEARAAHRTIPNLPKDSKVISFTDEA